MNDDEKERYKRHLSLNDFGTEGQLNLKNSSVIFIGAGGIGSSAILYIAAAGIGKIGIADGDKVEISNLQRQIIHNTSEIGNNKTNSARKNIKNLNPNCIIQTFTKRINSKNVIKIIDQFDIVCDCSDNFETRYLLNDACVILGKPLIYGSVQGFEGQISVFNLNQASPNLRDLIPRSPVKNEIPSCAAFGVVGISPGLIGILQANEIIKIIIKKGDVLDGKILVFNLLNNTMKKLTLRADIKNKKIYNLTTYKDDYESKEISNKGTNIPKINHLDFKKLYKQNIHKILIIDVREEKEFKKSSLKGSISIPLSMIKNTSSFELIRRKSDGKKIYTLCQKGIRSEEASKILIKEKIFSISIEGGLEKIREILLN